MARYVFWRLIWMVLLVLIIFVMIYFITSITMLRHWGRPPYDLREEFFFTVHQFVQYVRGIVTDWNWGTTGIYRENVWDFAAIRMWRTLWLNLLALSIYLPLGVGLGILSALKKHSVFDKTVHVLTMVLGSIPHFILGFLLIVFLGIRNRWLPWRFPGFNTDDTERFLLGLVIPLIALCLGPIFKFTRLVRAEFIEAESEDYLLLCKTKGMKKGQALRRHAFRNCMVPVMPELTPTFLYVLGGSFFIELMYGFDGVARLMMRSTIEPMMDFFIINIDIPVAVVTTVFYASLGMMFALIVDITYPLVDPRIRIGKKKAILD